LKQKKRKGKQCIRKLLSEELVLKGTGLLLSVRELKKGADDGRG